MKGEPIVVLLVEDDAAHAEIVRRNFADCRLANRLLHVSDGQAALDYLHHQNGFSDPATAPRPGIILLDLRLPKVNGLEVLQQIKADPQFSSIPVVVLTTSQAEQDMVQAYALHANSYLVKPVDFTKFTELMTTFGCYWVAWNQYPDWNNMMHMPASMTTTPLHLVIVEDNAAHVEAIRRAFEDNEAPVNIHAVGTLRDYRAYIDEHAPDLALVDLNLPDGRAVEILTSPPEDAPFPILVMTAFGSQPIVVEVMKAGALDYVVKSPEVFADMPHMAERILREWNLLQSHKQMEMALRARDSRHSKLLANIGDVIVIIDQDGINRYKSPNIEQLFGWRPEEVIGTHALENVHPEDRAHAGEFIRALFREPQATGSTECRYRCKDGQYKWIEFVGINLSHDPDINGLLGNYHNITARKQAEELIKQEQVIRKAIIDSIPGSFYMLDANGQYFSWNAYQREVIIGKPEGQIAGMNAIDTIYPDDRELVQSKIANVLSRKSTYELVESRVLLHGGPAYKWLLMTGQQIMIDNSPFLVGIGIDITERKKLEMQHAALEAQLRQQQRLETVGQLAAGIAHDFNNLLTGITGFTLFVHDAAPEGSATRNDLAEVLNCAKRAADLTHQLLAFSRKQPLHPVVLDINEIISASVTMLQRLLGEHLQIRWHPATPLQLITVDAGQFEQVLINLAINARDAMPDGGSLAIETANVVLDETYAASHVGVTPGAYVMLAVTDTGSGIEQSVLAHIFEPFFTTKGLGQGTGLGLATIYGIVKQHGGNIWVYSEPGQGTTFKVYWPVAMEDAGTPTIALNTALPTGTATILLVEDNNTVLQVTARQLQSLGYTVCTAALPSAAATILQAQGDAIDLLLTDVMMPECSGLELYASAHARYPRLRVLFMSGFTENAIADRLHDLGAPILEKPFTIHTLAQTVRAVLDGGYDVNAP